jgi:sugar/nucleoside kinase (ribokinase family)
MSRTDWIFLNHLSEPSSKIPGEILRLLKKHPSVRLAWNPGKEQFTDGIGKWKDLLAHTDVLFLNKEEAAQFSGIPYHPAGMKSEDPKFFTHIKRGFLPPYADDVSDILHAFLKTGVKNVVITDGGNGSQATDSRRLYFCPVLRHKRVDSTGAGDAFASGFTAGLMLGKTVKDCLRFGTINAYHVIQQFGAQKGLLTLEAMESEAKTLDICVESTKLN